MVGVNNGFQTGNNPVMDAYFRNVFECQNSSQTALLPVVTFLVGLTEESKRGVAVLPYSILESEHEYLTFLQQKYHKRTFRFEIASTKTEESPIYDTLTKLIRKTRKYTDYALLDASDLFERYPTHFDENDIPFAFSQRVSEMSAFYNHTIPSALESVLDEQRQSDETNRSKGLLRRALAYVPPDEKYNRGTSSVIDVYSTVVDEVRRHAIDFEVLKLYDYLVEIPFSTVRSNKLLEIESTLRRIGQTEYAKQPYHITILPLRHDRPPSTHDIILDDWASNIRKGIELRDSLQTDMQDLYDTLDH